MSIYDDAGLLDPPGAGDDGTVAGPRYWDQSIGAWRKYGNKKFMGDVDFHKGVTFLGNIPLLPDETPTENLQATSFQHVETRITDAKNHADTQASNAQSAASSYTDIEVTGLRNTIGDVLFAAEGEIGDEPSDVGTVGLYRNLRTFAEARRDEANDYTDSEVTGLQQVFIPNEIDGALSDYSGNVIAVHNFSSEENNPSQTVVGEIIYQRDQAIDEAASLVNGAKDTLRNERDLLETSLTDQIDSLSEQIDDFSETVEDIVQEFLEEEFEVPTPEKVKRTSYSHTFSTDDKSKYINEYSLEQLFTDRLWIDDKYHDGSLNEDIVLLYVEEDPEIGQEEIIEYMPWWQYWYVEIGRLELEPDPDVHPDYYRVWDPVGEQYIDEMEDDFFEVTELTPLPLPRLRGNSVLSSRDAYGTGEYSMVLASTRVKNTGNHSLVVASQNVLSDEDYVIVVGHGPEQDGNEEWITPTSDNIHFKLYSETGNIWTRGTVESDTELDPGDPDTYLAPKKYVDDRIEAKIIAIGNVEGDLSDHMDDTSPHEATSDATAERIVLRDGNGRAKFAEPDDDADAATKLYVDNVQGNLDTHIGDTGPVHGAVSAPTADQLILRDGDGRAQVADPDVAADIATRGWVEGHVTSELDGYATEDWVNNTALDGYATETWVNGEIEDFVTQADIDSSLESYATEDWVTNTALDGYATESYVDTEISNLNLGTLSTQNSDDVDITGGSIVVTAPSLSDRKVRNIFITDTEPTNMEEGDVWIVPEE